LRGVGAVTWSPDGQQLLAVGSEDPDGLTLWQGWLYRLQPGQKPQRLTDDSLRPFLSFPPISRAPEWRWTEDHRILFLGESQGESYLYQVPAGGGKAQRLSSGGCLNAGLALEPSGRIAVTLATSPTSPGDLHYLDTATGAGEQLTSYNQEYLAQHPPAQLEKFTLERNGLEIQCRLFRPADFDSARKYPLVLDIHGGPNGAFYDSFVPWQQVLAAAGYLVLAVNPRGSSTYGNDFMKAVLEDWGGEDYLDLMAAVDQVSARDYVDETRLGVHGYSYGGYMTSWMVGHTPRFKAAVVGAPCIDLVSMYGTSDIGVSFGEVQWGGSPADNFQELVKHSPLTYAAQVETPVLLLHGEADLRCPISQSEAYFVQLKRLGKEVELVRFPGCSHLFLRFGHVRMREEYLARTLAWFNKHLA
jgi:dipeptidyl aminopeptidase/acylaminoacyl peptidase